MTLVHLKQQWAVPASQDESYIDFVSIKLNKLTMLLYNVYQSLETGQLTFKPVRASEILVIDEDGKVVQ